MQNFIKVTQANAENGTITRTTAKNKENQYSMKDITRLCSLVGIFVVVAVIVICGAITGNFISCVLISMVFGLFSFVVAAISFDE